MPLPQNWNNKRRRKKPPDGFDVVEPVLEALENELRDKVKETNAKKRKTESMWPVHQINWQKSRYVFDMYYTHNRISKQVYLYCVNNKLVDAALIAKWKKPGYERLCSTYVINPSNYKFGTTSICRVPWTDRGPDQKNAQDPTTGCMGCASGKGGGPRNIFGNKYGQNLAAVQIAREQRFAAKRAKMEAERRRHEQLQQQRQEEEEEQRKQQQQQEHDDDDGEAETDDDETDDDDDDDDDYGPSPAAGIWAGSQKLQQESERIADPDEEDEYEVDEDAQQQQQQDDDESPRHKKVRLD